MIDTIADYMETHNIGTVGEDIFLGELPVDTVDTLAVILTPSPEPHTTAEVQTEYYDVWGKFTDAESGLAKMKLVEGLFIRKPNWTLGNYYVYFSHIINPTADFDKDSNRNQLFRLTIRLTYRIIGS